MFLWVCRVWQTQLLTHCCLGMEFITHINEGVDAAEFPVLREATEQRPCWEGGDFNVSQDKPAARLHSRNWDKSLGFGSLGCLSTPTVFRGWMGRGSKSKLQDGFLWRLDVCSKHAVCGGS